MEIVSKQLSIREIGHYRSPLDDAYSLDRDTDEDLLKLFNMANEAITEAAELSGERCSVLSSVDEIGFFSPNLRTSYRLDNYLIDNLIRQKDGGLAHEVSLAGLEKELVDGFYVTLQNRLTTPHRMVDRPLWLIGLYRYQLDWEVPAEFELSNFRSLQEATRWLIYIETK